MTEHHGTYRTTRIFALFDGDDRVGISDLKFI
jgi:hypothetical protein